MSPVPYLLGIVIILVTSSWILHGALLRARDGFEGDRGFRIGRTPRAKPRAAVRLGVREEEDSNLSFASIRADEEAMAVPPPRVSAHRNTRAMRLQADDSAATGTQVLMDSILGNDGRSSSA